MANHVKYPSHLEVLEDRGGRLPDGTFRHADLLRLAYQYAWEHSDDPKTKNGGVLRTRAGILVYGTNHLPPGIEVTEERITTAIKDDLIIHAEEDMVFNAAEQGIATRDAILYCAWAPCTRCAWAIIGAGIAGVIVHKQMHDRTYEKYRANIELAVERLQEAGVGYHRYDGPIGGCQGRMNNEDWNP